MELPANAASMLHTALLANRTLLRCHGSDATRFLQGLISQDVRLVAAGQPIFAALLTPQGKYSCDFFVVPDFTAPQHPGFLLDCPQSQAQTLLKQLTFFRLRAQVTLEAVAAPYAIFAHWPGQPGQTPPAPPSASDFVFTDCRTAALGQRRISFAPTMVTATMDAASYRQHRYQLGIPEGEAEIAVGKATLLELNFDFLNAISWNKGCYMGQELTARTHYRGLIKKRYLPFAFTGTPPQLGENISDGSVVVGEIKAVAQSNGLALCTLAAAKEMLSTGRVLAAGDAAVRLGWPDFLDKAVLGA